MEKSDNDQDTANAPKANAITSITVTQNGVTKSLPIISIDNIRDTVKFSFEYSDLDKTIGKGALAVPFDTYTPDSGITRYMALPKNIESLKSNILVQAVITIADVNNYMFVKTDADFAPTLTNPDPNAKAFLSGYLAVCKSRDLPAKDTFKDRGYAYKGMLEATSHWFEANKISRLAIKQSSKTLHEMFIKDRVANKMESKILDTIISIWKGTCGSLPSELNLVVMSNQEINTAFGLTFEVKSAAINDKEVEIINNFLSLMNIKTTCKLINVDKISKAGYLQLISDIAQRQKDVKAVKISLKTNVEKRLTSVYSSYKNKKQYQGKQFSELVNRDIKGTKAYKAFNPTCWMKILNLIPAPDNDPVPEGTMDDFNTWFSNNVANQLQTKNVESATLSIIKDLYFNFLKDQQTEG